jgi:hypothetical protein
MKRGGTYVLSTTSVNVIIECIEDTVFYNERLLSKEEVSANEAESIRAFNTEARRLVAVFKGES